MVVVKGEYKKFMRAAHAHTEDEKKAALAEQEMELIEHSLRLLLADYQQPERMMAAAEEDILSLVRPRLSTL